MESKDSKEFKGGGGRDMSETYVKRKLHVEAI